MMTTPSPADNERVLNALKQARARLEEQDGVAGLVRSTNTLLAS